MFTLIVLVLVALIFSLFATANTSIITITLFGSIISLPLYIIIGVTLLIGLGISWIINLIDNLYSAIKISGKEHDIKDANAKIREQNKRINELEVENARLSERTRDNNPILGFRKG